MRNRGTLGLALAAGLLPVLWQGASADSAPASSSGGTQTVQSGNRVAQVDKSGKGAVLCVWAIYDAVRLVGRECHPGQDQAFQAELDQSLARIDDFIIANSASPVSREALNARRVQGLRMLQVGGSLCAGDAEKLYQMLRASGAAALRAQTTDLLSIPREPVMNPCL